MPARRGARSGLPRSARRCHPEGRREDGGAEPRAPRAADTAPRDRAAVPSRAAPRAPGAAGGTAGLRSPPAGGTKAVRRGRERPRAEGGGAPSPGPRPPPAAGGAKREPAAPPAGRRRRSTAQRRPRPLKEKALLRWNGSPSAPRLGPPRSGSAPPRDPRSAREYRVRSQSGPEGSRCLRG